MFYMEPAVIDGKLFLNQWSRDGIETIDAPFLPYCYIGGIDGEGWKEAFKHKPVKKFSAKSQEAIANKRWQTETWEADIPYERRVMLDLDWKIEDVPKVYVDIETDDSHGFPKPERDPIMSIALIFDDGREVWLYGDEEEMLDEFMQLTENVGMIITYNGGEDVWETRSFDLPYIAHRFGKGKKYDFDYRMRHCAFIDIYQIYKYETSRVGKAIAGGFSLDNVCLQELGHGKIKVNKKFSELSKEELKRYNMEDVRILKELDEKFSFSDAKIKLAQLTNLNLCSWRRNKKRNELKPLIMIDNLILKEGRRLKLAWPNREFDKEEKKIEGALVLEPKPGIYDGVQNFDVKQMYPSIMINERISPDKNRVVLPNILIELKQLRATLKEKYMQSRLKSDFLTQYGYKILANVFYGAIGNQACRVYNYDFASAITRKGRQILSNIKELCESAGYNVVYGDTDSVFVKIEKEKTEALEKIINTAVEPYEIERGEYYDKILFLGDEHGGSKKRYAGITGGTIKTVGVESVRRDYCVLARETQLLMLHKLLGGHKPEDVKKCMINLNKIIRTGEYDPYLVINKGVKPIKEYKTVVNKTKTGKVHRGLPHIRALKKSIAMGHQQGFDISFVYTREDVEPVFDTIPKNIDYDLYFDRQLMAVVRPLLRSIGVLEEEKKKRRKRKQIDEHQTSLLQHISS